MAKNIMRKAIFPGAKSAEPTDLKKLNLVILSINMYSFARQQEAKTEFSRINNK